jgi:hypothetical protein
MVSITITTKKQTQVIDEIHFELPYGILGKLFDGYVYRRLEKIFCNRKLATIRALENNIYTLMLFHMRAKKYDKLKYIKNY